MHLKIVPLSLLFSLTLMLCPVSAQQEVGNGFVAPDTTAAILVKPAAVYQTPLLQMVPWEVLDIKSKQFVGVSIQTVESVLITATPPLATGTPAIGAVVRLAEPAQLNSLFPELQKAGKLKLATWPRTETKYLKGDPALMLDIYPIDEKTYLVGMTEAIEAMLAQKQANQPSEMAKLIQQNSEPAEFQAFLLTEPIRDLAHFLLADPRLNRFPSIRALPQQVEHAQLIADMDMEKGGVTLKLTAKSPADAKQLQQTVDHLLNTAVALATQMAEPPITNEAEEKAFRQYLQRVTNNMKTALEPTVDGSQVTLTTVGKPGTSPQVLIASGAAVLLPTIEAARIQGSRNVTFTHLKQIMLAMHNHYSTFQELPRDILDKDGKPLLSWRVKILPFVEQAALYQQFHLDEPWDSEHNLKLAKLVPAVYLSPDSQEELGPQQRTRYLLPLGEGFPASVPAGPLKFKDLVDGSSNTIAVLETPVKDAVLWTKPDDFHVDVENIVEAVVPGDAEGVNMAHYDGSVKYYEKSELSEKRLKGLFTHQGGEVVE